MSLLLANGHVHAQNYPIGMVVEEASYVVERQDRAEASHALLLQLAVSSLFSKKGGTAFRKQIKQLSGD